MKSLAIFVLCLCCFSAFGFGFGGKKKDATPEIIPIHTDNGVVNIEMDYDLKTADQKLAKLQAIEGYEAYVLNQVLIENEKYEKLIVQRASDDYRSGKMNSISLEKKILKQEEKAIQLLTQKESLSKYIDWLKS